ncbi:hypothetical protein EOL94_00415 [bacterium]|nr:hypothetical protein [bacterium]
MKDLKIYGMSWFIGTIAVFSTIILTLVIIIGSLTPINNWILFGVFLLSALFFSVKTFLNGFFTIPENYKAVLLNFNQFSEVLDPGPKVVFPYFSVYSLGQDSDGDEILFSKAIESLYLLKMDTVREDMKNKDYSETSEFKDGQAWVVCDVTYRVIDPEKAFRHRQGFKKDILAKFRELLNNFLKEKIIEDLLKNSSIINIDNIDPGSDNYRDKYLREDGVEIIDFRLQDIVLTPQTSEARDKILQSSVEIDVAKNQRKVVSILAIADRNATKDSVKAWVYASEELKSLGYTDDQVRKLLETHIKWDTLEKTEKMKWEAFKNAKDADLIVGSSDAMMGAAASTGFEKSKNKETEN